jgi:hypothetical protein
MGEEGGQRVILAGMRKEPMSFGSPVFSDVSHTYSHLNPVKTGVLHQQRVVRCELDRRHLHL